MAGVSNGGRPSDGGGSAEDGTEGVDGAGVAGGGGAAVDSRWAETAATSMPRGLSLKGEALFMADLAAIRG